MKDLKHTYQPKKGFQNGLSDLLSGKVLEKGLFELPSLFTSVCS